MKQFADSCDIRLDCLFRDAQFLCNLYVCLSFLPFHLPDGLRSIRDGLKRSTDDSRDIPDIDIFQSGIKDRHIKSVIHDYQSDTSQIIQRAVLDRSEKVGTDRLAYVYAV